MCFNFLTTCVIPGLLLILAGAEVINEAKTYTKEIHKISDLGKDDQVIVEKGDDLIAQYVCQAGDCTYTPDTVGQLTGESGYLVLTMQNISAFDRFDAFKWNKSGKTILLKDFTLNEVLPTSATPDPTLNPSITQTVPPTSTTPSPAEEAHNQRLLDPPNMTATTKALIGVGVALAAVAAVATLVAVVRDLKSGRDGRIARAIAFFRRRSCDSAPNRHDEDSMEMQSLAAPVHVDMGHLAQNDVLPSMESVQCAQNCME